MSYISLGLSILSVATLFYYEDNLALYYQKDADIIIPTSENENDNDVKGIIELNINSEHSTNHDSEVKISANSLTLQNKLKQYGEFWKVLLVIWRYSEIVI